MRDGRGRFCAGMTGNPAGRPKGTRAKLKDAVLFALEEATPGLIRKAVELAMGGEGAVLTWLLSRVLAPAKDRPVVGLQVPPVTAAADAVVALNYVMGAMNDGEIAPGEAMQIASTVMRQAHAVEVSELAVKVEALQIALGELEEKHRGH